MREILAAFVQNGGAICACGTCTKPRSITEQQLVPGAKIVTAASIVEVMAGGASTLSL